MAAWGRYRTYRERWLYGSPGELQPIKKEEGTRSLLSSSISCNQNVALSLLRTVCVLFCFVHWIQCCSYNSECVISLKVWHVIVNVMLESAAEWVEFQPVLFCIVFIMIRCYKWCQIKVCILLCFTLNVTTTSTEWNFTFLFVVYVRFFAHCYDMLCMWQVENEWDWSQKSHMTRYLCL